RLVRASSRLARASSRVDCFWRKARKSKTRPDRAKDSKASGSDIPVKTEPAAPATAPSQPALNIPIDDPHEPQLDWGTLENELDNAQVVEPKPSAVDLPAADPKPSATSAPKPASKRGPKSPKGAGIGPQIIESEEQRTARELRKNLDKAPTQLVKQRIGDFELPPLSFLDLDDHVQSEVDHEKLRLMAMQLEKTLGDFGVEGKVVEICPGPVITMFEFSPAPGVKISKIANLSDDLAMALAAMSVRIIAPIPGKGVVGIEVPNETRETVYLKEIIAHDKFQKSRARMPIALGKNTAGGPVSADLAKMPHLLVAGATGSGKSVAVNTMIVSLLFRFTPEDVRLILVDPKMLEFSIYSDIPHLLLPVVTDPQKAAVALKWAVDEMEKRYQLLADMGVRNIQSYNKRVQKLTQEAEADLAAGRTDSEAVQQMDVNSDGVPKHVKLPYIVCIIDEFADLMMVASKDVETCVARLAQKARAAGIHLILATQRPSVDVITGLIKANFPTRIALRVAQRTDSRTILDSNGAEHLLGRGDMLFLPPGTSQQQRVHGAYVSETEIDRIVDFLKSQGEPQYDESILAHDGGGDDGDGGERDDDRDEHYDRAIEIVTSERQASISMLQRKLRIGYNRAARIVDHMEEDGIVGPSDGSKPREVLVPPPPSL
ncbi:MAG: DNA translocase FtsK, partial [Myxococcota bacterium]